MFYDPGVGTESSAIKSFFGRMFGDGIDTNIKQMYEFLSQNYEDGDHIYLFGYSRGAYTVRSLAGLVHRLGLLRQSFDKQEIEYAYELYRAEVEVESPEAVEFRQRHGRHATIKLLACFDTVGALGVSDRSPWPLSLLSRPSLYKFHDMNLNKSIEHAIHALSIDEDFFIPTLMEACPGQGSEQLTQKYLPGYHAGVGGGLEEEQGLTDNALWFMVDEMKKRGLMLDLNMKEVPRVDVTEVQLRRPVEYFSVENLAKVVSGEYIRRIADMNEVHDSAVRRYMENPSWRPKALRGLEDDIAEFGAGTVLGQVS